MSLFHVISMKYFTLCPYLQNKRFLINYLRLKSQNVFHLIRFMSYLCKSYNRPLRGFSVLPSTLSTSMCTCQLFWMKITVTFPVLVPFASMLVFFFYQSAFLINMLWLFSYLCIICCFWHIHIFHYFLCVYYDLWWVLLLYFIFYVNS